MADRSAENRMVGNISISAWHLEDRAEQRMSLSHIPESVSGRVRDDRGGPLWRLGRPKVQVTFPVCADDAACWRELDWVNDSSHEICIALQRHAAAFRYSRKKHNCFKTLFKNSREQTAMTLQNQQLVKLFFIVSVWGNLVQDVPVPHH